jgi:hypothetical protein
MLTYAGREAMALVLAVPAHGSDHDCSRGGNEKAKLGQTASQSLERMHACTLSLASASPRNKLQSENAVLEVKAAAEEMVGGEVLVKEALVTVVALVA